LQICKLFNFLKDGGG